MKVAYLPAFKFNLTSRGVNTLPNKLADDHDLYQSQCKLTQYIIQSFQKEWSFMTQRHQIMC